MRICLAVVVLLAFSAAADICTEGSHNCAHTPTTSTAGATPSYAVLRATGATTASARSGAKVAQVWGGYLSFRIAADGSTETLEMHRKTGLGPWSLAASLDITPADGYTTDILEVSTNGDHIVAAGLYITRSGNTLTWQSSLPDVGCTSAAMNADGDRLVCGTANNATAGGFVLTRGLASWFTDQKSLTLIGSAAAECGDRVAMSGDGSFVAVSCNGTVENNFYVYHSSDDWATSSSNPIFNSTIGYGVSNDSAPVLSFTADGGWLAVTNGASPYLRLYKCTTTTCTLQAPGFTGITLAALSTYAAFDAAGDTLVVTQPTDPDEVVIFRYNATGDNYAFDESYTNAELGGSLASGAAVVSVTADGRVAGLATADGTGANTTALFLRTETRTHIATCNVDASADLGYTCTCWSGYTGSGLACSPYSAPRTIKVGEFAGAGAAAAVVAAIAVVASVFA